LTVTWAIAVPVSSMMQMACSDHDQSTPAYFSGPSAVVSSLVEG